MNPSQSSSPSLAEARALHQAGQLESAEEVYAALVEASPENPQVLYLAGMVALQLGQLDKARARLDLAAARAPDDPAVWMGRGQLEQVARNWRGALSCFDRLLQLTPNDSAAQSRRAYALEMDGRVEEASLGYRQSLETAFAGLDVRHYSPWRNIYHCCVQKTASQWLRRLFSDPDFYQSTGLLMQPFVQLGLDGAELDSTWPSGTVVTHLYTGFDAYDAMPKPGEYRTFFVMRDPRDCVVSWYYSARYSHNWAQPIVSLRERLSECGEQEGMAFIIDWLAEVGFFRAQASWLKAQERDSAVKLVRYEALNRSPITFVDELFEFLQIPMTASEREELCHRHAWEMLAGGRTKGDENQLSHYRRAKTGGWRDAFSISTLDHFNAVTGDLVNRLGYEA